MGFDIDHEFKMAQSRIDATIRRGEREALLHINRLTPTERREVKAGLREDPVIAGLRSAGVQLAQLVDAIASATKAFADGFYGAWTGK